MRKEQTAPPLYGAGLCGGRRGVALREGGFCRWKKIGQFSKIRCNLPLYRIQYKYRAGPIDADGSSADIFIGRVILTCGGIEKTEKDEMRSTMSDMIG